MILIFIYTSIAVALVFLLISLINLLWGPYLSSIEETIKKPFVSILVPARNEEENIGNCLDYLVRLDYENYEIIILDDDSSDRTSEIVMKYQKKYKNLQLVKGEPLPPGWTGKNWACWQLAKAAKGELFIFTDADNWFHPQSVSKTIAWMEKYRLSALSAFPQQITLTFTEKLLILVIDIILYTMLPLWLVLKTKNSSVSAANGQWLAFRRKEYFSTGGHQSVKNKVVEDVEIFRLFKRNNKKVLTVIGTNMIFCRMYNNLPEVARGLAKIFFGLTGNKILIYILLVGIMFLVYIFPWIALMILDNWLMVLPAIALPILYRIVMKIQLREDWLGVWFQPVTILLSIMIAFKSYYAARTNNILWKGRKISVYQTSFQAFKKVI
jgi:chlorobactene glucosyltransferase